MGKEVDLCKGCAWPTKSAGGIPGCNVYADARGLEREAALRGTEIKCLVTACSDRKPAPPGERRGS